MTVFLSAKKVVPKPPTLKCMAVYTAQYLKRRGDSRIRAACC